MFELMIMRHAKSDWSNYTSDKQRPLNNRGCQDAARMGEHLNNLGLIPDRLIVSSARRTQQTADILLTHMNIAEQQIIISDSLYLASVSSLLKTIKEHAEDNRRIMILAHNPGVDELVTYLSDSPPSLTKNGNLMTTGAVALLQLNALDDINHAGMAGLSQMLRPKELA